MNKKLGILITAYNDFNQVLENIRHIRSFPKIGKSEIVVISTAHQQNIVDSFYNMSYSTGVQPLTVKVIDVPGNPNNEWEPPSQEYISWRHKYLSPRIFKSFDIGFNLLDLLNCDIGLNLHSDTFLQRNYEDVLLNEIEECSTIGAIWDICKEDSGNQLHVHPENIMINLRFWKTHHLLPISNCYHSNFKAWNWGCIEGLIGGWAYYKLTGISPESNSETTEEFKTLFKTRIIRDYHGNFPHIINLAGEQ